MINLSIKHDNVVNKNIIYSDSILKINDLVVTTIFNVCESDLEDCLNIIFESNKKVIFNTIQYSRKDKKVYFYTEDVINIKYYEERFKKNNYTSKILEELKKLLNCDCDDKNYISLYSLSKYIRNMNIEYNLLIEDYKDKINNVLVNKVNKYARVIIYDFDYKENILKIGFKRWSDSDYKDIYIKKDNGNLYVFKSKSLYTKEFFHIAFFYLLNLYDEFIKFSDYQKEYAYNINVINSFFSVDIDKYKINLFAKFDSFKNEFELASYSYNDNYKIICNSNIINEIIENNEDEIFKRIFVSISDCPKCYQDDLYKYRELELSMNKNFKKRILSFFNNK